MMVNSAYPDEGDRFSLFNGVKFVMAGGNECTAPLKGGCRPKQ
jgi:hypothetical protein